jgi:hypothetical protein
MRQAIPLLSAFLFIFIFSSCESLMNNGGGVTSPTHSLSASHSGTKPMGTGSNNGGDLRAIMRFHTNIKAKGSFKPGEPIKLSVNVKANLPTPSARVRLFSPIISALKHRKGGRTAMIPVDKPLTPLVSWTQSLSQGQVFSHQRTIMVKQPGYYHIFLSVNTTDAKKLLNGRLPVENAATNDLWIWITKRGGKATQTFDSTLISDNYRKQPGPRTGINEPQQIKFGQKIIPHTSGSIVYEILYKSYNIQNIMFKYFKDGTAEYLIYHDGNPFPIDSKLVPISNGGLVFIPCSESAPNTYYVVRFYNANDKVVVNNPWLTSLAASASGNLKDNCGLVFQIKSSRRTAYLFENMNKVIDNARSFFQKSRGRINVYAYDSGHDTYYTNDMIVIYDKDANHTIISGGHYGQFVIAHEYGHAFQNKELGGLPNYSCQPHVPGGAYSLGCAYGEGFGDYFASVTSTNIIPYLTIEDDLNYDGQPSYIGCLHVEYYEDGSYKGCNEYASQPDGPIVEGAVASFLYDLTDPGNESFDNAYYPGSFIANIMKNCRVKVSGDWSHPDGIDELIACLQFRLPNYSNHFSTRNNPPTDYNDNELLSIPIPSGWSRTAIRKLWHKNLYNESYLPPPSPPTPFEVSIDGPDIIRIVGSYTWTAVPEHGDGSYSYQWQYRKGYGDPWTDVATTKTYTRDVEPQEQTTFFQLRVKVTSGTKQVSDFMIVTVPKWGCQPPSICIG